MVMTTRTLVAHRTQDERMFWRVQNDLPTAIDSAVTGACRCDRCELKFESDVES